MTNLAGKIAGVLVLLGLIILGTGASRMYEYNDAGNVLFVQYPSGSLGIFTDQGYKPQWFGSTSTFKKSNQFWFTEKNIVKVKFNDGGHGYISGSVRYDLPSDEKSLSDIFSTFKTQDALEQELIRTVVEKATFMTGPLMSSKESAASKRPDLLRFMEDQASLGVYMTHSKPIQITDEISGDKKWIDGVEILPDLKNPGQFARQEVSPLERFHVRLYNMAIGDIKYDDIVEKQIEAQQKMTMEIQTAIATSKKAEQEAITVEQQGKANAATAKWAQEVIKATEMTKAEQEKAVALTSAAKSKEVAEMQAEQQRNVAKLGAEQAELEKQAAISKGEGEAKANELKVKANNYVPEKIQALVHIAEVNANALKDYKGDLVPRVIIGGNSATSGTPTGGAQNDAINTLLNLKLLDSAQTLGVNLKDLQAK